MLTEKSTAGKSVLQAIGKSFSDSIGDIVFGALLIVRYFQTRSLASRLA